MSLGNEPIYENIAGANVAEDRQFDYVVQMNHIEDNDIEQRRLSEVRNESKDSIVQVPGDMDDKERSTLIKRIQIWSQVILDRFADEEDSDGEFYDKIFARRQSIPANGRVVVNSTKNADQLSNLNASNSAEEVLSPSSDTQLPVTPNPIDTYSGYDEHIDENAAGGAYLDEIKNDNLDNELANDAPNKTEDNPEDNTSCTALLDAIITSDTQLPVTPNPIDTYSGDDEPIYENAVGGAYLDESKNDNLGNDLANDATNKTEDNYINAFCKAFLDVIISSDTPLTATSNAINAYSGCDEHIYDTPEFDYENAYLDENQSSLEIPAPPNTQLWTPRLELAIQELIDTEKTYIGSMEYFIEQYVKYFLNDPKKRLELPGIRVIFGNIEYLYESSKNIFEEFIKCNLSVDCIANVFLQSKPLFKLYADYLRNKARKKATLESMYKKHLKQRQEKLKDKNTWDSYLSAPVQRLLTYKTLLGELQNELNTIDKVNKNLEAAIIFVDQSTRQIDTLLAIDSIYDCPIDLENIGGMHLLKDKFNIKRKYKSIVFLFEGAIVFTTRNKLQKEIYDYKDSINVNVLALKSCSESTFIVSNHSECKLPDSHSFELENSSQAVCETWMKQIRYILRNQNK